MIGAKTVRLGVRLAISDFLARHEGSLLGLLWYLLNPALTFAVLYVVFVERLGSSIEHYAVYLICGIIFFRYLERTIVESTRIIRSNAKLIKSIPFSPVALLLGIIGQYGISLLIESIVLIVVAWFAGVGFTALLLLVGLPFIMLIAAGSALIIAPLAVYVRDFEEVARFGTWLLFFATPIFYESGSWILTFNPLATTLDWTRGLMLHGTLPVTAFIASALSGLLLTAVGIMVYRTSASRISQWI